MVNSVVNRSMSTKTFRQKQSRILLHDVCGLVSGFFKRFRMFILLMVQKSGIHHLRVVVSPIIYKGFSTFQTVVGISDIWTINNHGVKGNLGIASRPGCVSWDHWLHTTFSHETSRVRQRRSIKERQLGDDVLQIFPLAFVEYHEGCFLSLSSSKSPKLREKLFVPLKFAQASTESFFGVSKNRGVSPKMDGENNGKPY